MKTNPLSSLSLVLCVLVASALTGRAQPATQISAGGYHGMFVLSDGSLWAWGNGFSGEMGDGAYDATNMPTKILTNGVTTTAGGESHSIFLKSDGSLWVMGNNINGQLGDGTFKNTYNPEQIVSNGVTAIAAGYFFSFFLKSDGSLWAMGDNQFGQLGDGTTDDGNFYTNLPEMIMPSGVKAIAGGDHHSLFLQSDGSLWAAGYNINGQLGDGTTDGGNQFTNLPEMIVPNGVKAIATGWECSLFIKSDGSLWGMGNNAEGQLGDGTYNNANRPEQIVPGNVSAIVAAYGFSLFLQSDGSLWAMGYNSDGQLGDGTTNDVNQPEEIVSSGVTAIAAGLDFSLFLKSDGSVWAMGGNHFGEVGDGSTNVTGTSRPVQIWPQIPVINTQPTNQTVVAGRNAIFTVTVTGTSLAYQWFSTVGPIGGATNAVLTLLDAQDADANTYHVVVTNVNGSVTSSNATLTVVHPPAIANQPQSQTIPPGSSMTLTVAATGTAPLSYQWDFNGFAISGATSSALTFSNATSTNAGSYQVIITNAYGSATSSVAIVSAMNTGIYNVIQASEGSMFITADGSLWGMGNNATGALGVGINTPPSSIIPSPEQIVAGGVTAVACGQGLFTLFLKSDGSLWGMGLDLVSGPYYSTNQPVQIVSSGVTVIASGVSHALFLKSDGSLWGIGLEGEGALGLGFPQGNYYFPPQLIVSNGVTAIAAGAGFSLFLKSDGSLWAMGANNYGELGDGTQIDKFSPELIVSSNVTAIAAGDDFSLFLKSDGSLWGMGDDQAGQLGDGIPNVAPYTPENPVNPVLIVSNGVTAIAAGQSHSLFLKSDGSLWGMGAASSGQRGYFVSNVGPEQIVAGGVTAIAAGGNDSLFIKSDGSLWGMGENGSDVLGDGGAGGELGNVDMPEQIWPTNVVLGPPVISIQPVSQRVLIGTNTTLSVSASGSSPLSYQWGLDGVPISGATSSSLPFADASCANAGNYQVVVSNAYGSVTSSVATLVVTTITVTNIAAGDYNSLFIKSDGSLWVMGDNYYGELGDGTYNNTNRPEELVSSNVTAVAGGGYDSFFLKSDGSLWAMGYNGYGALGDGTSDGGTYQTNLPEMIVSSNVTAIAAGEGHTLFIKNDSSLWGMGGNYHGQLGDGTHNGRTSPEQIVSGGVTAIAAGYFHSLFLKSDGSLWVMGYNNDGQLGDGTTNDVNQPEQIVSSGVTAISAGQYHSLFLKSDGSLWVMGNNSFGQLGDGTTINATQPEQIVASGVTAIAAGFYHSMFARSDGSLWTMGGNFQGQLGDGTSDGGTLRTNRPEQVVASGVVMLAAGSGHSLFVKSDGSLWAMGNNAEGALGDGTTDNGTYSTNRPEQIIGTSGPIPVITTQPVGLTVVGGSNATFFVTDIACSATYQWYKGATPIAGATNSALTLLDVQDADATNYSVVLENGTGSVASSNAALTVVDAPQITLQPQSQTNEAGTTSTFTVTATGTSPGYQWYEGATPIGGATNSTLTLVNVQQADATNYSVVLSNLAGTVTSSNAILTVINTPSITTQPASQITVVGNNVSFSVTAAGAQPLSFQWTLNGAAIPGATNSALALPGVGFTNAGDYQVVISNAYGSVTSTMDSLVITMNNVAKVAAGDYHSLFLKDDGSLWVMGDNYYGDLGDGTYTTTNRPEQIVSNGVVAIAGGGYDTLFLKGDGSLWAMGDDGYGQLGDGGTYQTNLPESIVSSNVIAVAAGEYHSLFVKTNGSLWGMGANFIGQLGDGTYNGRTSPEQIVSSGVTAVAAGYFHSLFLKSDGSLWAMGYNNDGQLGDGGMENQSDAPKQIVASGVAAIAAGQYHSLFVQSNGSLWVMGDNAYGQLGDGTTNNASQPEQIVPSGVTAVAAGFYHSLFLKSDGSLWGMGGNFQGQLGDGSTDNGTYRTNLPEQIVASNVTAIAAGGGHSLFVKSDGSLWVMGDNGEGALGDGSYNTTNRPEQILAGLTAPTYIAAFSFSGTSLVLNGVNGLAGTSYYVLESTNLFLPPSQWTRMAVTVLGTNGSFSITVTNAVDPNAAKEYYLIESP